VFHLTNEKQLGFLIAIATSFQWYPPYDGLRVVSH